MGWISIVGISMTAAPSSTSSRRNGSTWWRARAMRTRRPCSCRFDIGSRRGVENNRGGCMEGPPTRNRGGVAGPPPAGGEPQDDRLRTFDQPKADRRRLAFDGEGDAAHDWRGELDDEARHCFEVQACALELLRDLAAVGERVRVSGE